jgi:hypothetical protein
LSRRRTSVKFLAVEVFSAPVDQLTTGLLELELLLFIWHWHH